MGRKRPSARCRIGKIFLERSKWRYCEKQNCQFEPKKIWELEMKTRPNKAKNYSYTKVCREKPIEICDQYEKKSILLFSDMEERLICKYIPKEQCQDEDKQ